MYLSRDVAEPPSLPKKLRRFVAPISIALLASVAGLAFADDSGTWWPVPVSLPPLPPSPGLRVGHSMIFDPVGGRAILFGGADNSSGSSFHNDLWAIAAGAQSWTPLIAAGAPPSPRWEHAAVLDTRRNRMLVIGGQGASLDGDVWALSLSGPMAWTQIVPTGVGPTPRLGLSAVYDSTRDRVVIFGGADHTWNNETWFLWLGGTPRWEQLTTAFSPLPRYLHEAVYDPRRDRMLIYGGLGTGLVGADLWILTFAGTPAWSQWTSNAPPGARSGAASAYDGAQDQWLIVGGGSYPVPAWSLSLGSLKWTDLAPSRSPMEITNLAGAWDPASRVLIVHGLADASSALRISDQTWQLSPDGSPTWTLLVNPEPPGPTETAASYAAAMAFDAPRNRFLLFFGGANSPATVQELQIGRDSTWVIRPELQAPFPPRAAYSLDYDPGRDRWLLFGGYDGTNFLNDLWELRLAATPPWTQLTGLVPPPARDYQATIFDPSRDRLIVFGGNANGVLLNDLWQLRFSVQPFSWVPLQAFGTPPSPRFLDRAVYDPVGDRMLVFGGYDTQSLNDLWTLSFGTGFAVWSKLAPGGPLPPPRYGHSMVLDTNRLRILVMGGLEQPSGIILDDVWQLDLTGGPLTWQPLAPAGAAPSARYLHAAAYDPPDDRMLAAGGDNTGAVLGDTWRLQFGQVPTAVMATLQSASATSDGVTLRWDAYGDEGLAARIERREQSTGWTLLARVAITGLVEYQDRAVTPGGRYAYRLVVEDHGVDTPTAESWIDVPGQPAFALYGFQPNPSPAGRVAFSVPEAGEVRIELVDVTGRRVAEREAEATAPGRMTVDLAPGRPLAPGLYFIRLRQGDRTLVARGAVMR